MLDLLFFLLLPPVACTSLCVHSLNLNCLYPAPLIFLFTHYRAEKIPHPQFPPAQLQILTFVVFLQCFTLAEL